MFWYKANQHPSFKICNQQFWEMSKNIKHDDTEESYDPSVFKKKKHIINVKKTYKN